jgi:hypothetical protein
MLNSRRNILLMGRPGWVMANASLHFDFVNQRYYRPDINLLMPFTRTLPKYGTRASGLLELFPANTAAITDLGISIEMARTNVVLWNDDLTNAAWTASNITPLKDQIGPAGGANTASSIEATAGNGTILQAITLASSARFQSAYVKRITGTGVVEMTLDNGSTWTAVTVTAAWTRVSVPTQTLANPTVGFRIVTSGDKIAVAKVQNENGTYATSPIDVTTVAVTRDIDVATFNAPFDDLQPFVGMYEGSFYCEWDEVAGPVNVARRVFSLAPASGNGAMNFFCSNTTSKANFTLVDAANATVVNLASTGSLVAGITYRMACRWKTNDVAMALTAALNATILTDTSAVPTTVIGSNGRLGASVAGSQPLDGRIRQIVLKHVADPDQTLLDWAQAA